MNLKGKVVLVGNTQIKSETFQTRDLIVEYAENPTYPEYIRFEAMQDKCDLLDDLKEGDDVEVNFNLRGRPWTDKTGKVSYFNSLVVWKINKLEGQPAGDYSAPVDLNNKPGDDDDLPF